MSKHESGEEDEFNLSLDMKKNDQSVWSVDESEGDQEDKARTQKTGKNKKKFVRKEDQQEKSKNSENQNSRLSQKKLSQQLSQSWSGENDVDDNNEDQNPNLTMSENQNQLSKDEKQINTSWFNNEEQSNDEKPKRGNRPRGNRDEKKNYDYHQESRNFKKKKPYEEQKSKSSHYNNNYNNNNNHSNYNKGRGGGGKGRGGGWNKNEDYRGGNEQRNYNKPYRNNYYDHKNDYEEEEPKKQVSEIKQRELEKKIKPQGRKCWPQTSIYIMETKVSITYRHISQHIADVLVIPYKDTNMSIYPGSIINKCKVDYRKKIADKPELKQVGSVYVQKCVGIDNFKALAFLKVDGKDDSLFSGAKEVIRKISKLQMKLYSVLFPFTLEMGNPKPIIKGVIEVLEKGTILKDVTLTTNKSKDFDKGTVAFNQLVKYFIQENQICIDY